MERKRRHPKTCIKIKQMQKERISINIPQFAMETPQVDVTTLLYTYTNKRKGPVAQMTFPLSGSWPLKSSNVGATPKWSVSSKSLLL
jgi:hypothetical protein